MLTPLPLSESLWTSASQRSDFPVQGSGLVLDERGVLYSDGVRPMPTMFLLTFQNLVQPSSLLQARDKTLKHQQFAASPSAQEQEEARAQHPQHKRRARCSQSRSATSNRSPNTSSYTCTSSGSSARPKHIRAICLSSPTRTNRKRWPLSGAISATTRPQSTI